MGENLNEKNDFRLPLPRLRPGDLNDKFSPIRYNTKYGILFVTVHR